MVKDKESWHAAVHEVAELDVTAWLKNNKRKMNFNSQDLCFDCTHLWNGPDEISFRND